MRPNLGDFNKLAIMGNPAGYISLSGSLSIQRYVIFLFPPWMSNKQQIVSLLAYVYYQDFVFMFNYLSIEQWYIIQCCLVLMIDFPL